MVLAQRPQLGENEPFGRTQVRALFLSGHYRAQMNFTIEGLGAIEKSLHRLDLFVERVKGSKGVDKIDVTKFEKEFKEAISDDLNTPQAFAVLFDMIRYVNAKMDEKEINGSSVIELLSTWDKIFAFIFFAQKDEIPEELKHAAEKRFKARQEKNYEKADAMRALIEKAGFFVEDMKDKCVVRKKESYANDK